MGASCVLPSVASLTGRTVYSLQLVQIFQVWVILFIAVNEKMLSKLLQTTPFMAVFFCKFSF